MWGGWCPGVRVAVLLFRGYGAGLDAVMGLFFSESQYNIVRDLGVPVDVDIEDGPAMPDCLRLLALRTGEEGAGVGHFDSHLIFAFPAHTQVPTKFNRKNRCKQSIAMGISTIHLLLPCITYSLAMC